MQKHKYIFAKVTGAGFESHYHNFSENEKRQIQVV